MTNDGRTEVRPLPTDGRDVWERWEDEPNLHYHYFTVYRDMGPRRTVKKAALTLDRSDQYLAQVAREWRWKGRSVEWDRKQNSLAVEEREAKAKAMVEGHRALASAILVQTAKLIVPPKSVRLEDGTVRELTKEEREKWQAPPEHIRIAVNALDKASGIERLSFGLPTEITQTMVETEERVKAALDAQNIYKSIVSEALCDEPGCECCARVRERLAQAEEFRRRAAAGTLPVAG